MAEHDLDSIALPTLNQAQMAALGRCSLTTSRRYRDGEKLFEAGDRECKFDVVKSGEVELRDDSAEPSTTIVVLRPGQFTGDAAHLAAGPSLVTGVARGDCEVFEVSDDALRDLINRHLDLADIILRAFLARWRFLRESGRFIGLRVIGPRDSPETFRVRTFLAENGVPLTWLDLEADPRRDRCCGSSGRPRPTRPWSPGATGSCCGTPQTAISRRPSASAGRWSPGCTTWSWPGPGRRGSRRRSTARRRG